MLKTQQSAFNAKIIFFLGIGVVIVIALCCQLITSTSYLQILNFSPLMLGLLVGILYANILGYKIKEYNFNSGIKSCTRLPLQLGIILFGFEVTFNNILDIGAQAITACILVAVSTYILGMLLTKFLKIDKEVGMLTALGSGICGNVAILAVEPILKSKPYKTTIALINTATCGAITMFLFSFLYNSNFLQQDLKFYGIYYGATIHGVSHATALDDVLSSHVVTVVKMIKVILMTIFILLLPFFIAKTPTKSSSIKATLKHLPLFPFFFIMISILNSSVVIPPMLIGIIRVIGSFLFTMVMIAIGMEANIYKIKASGFKPLLLTGILCCWLVFAGYFITIFSIKLF